MIMSGVFGQATKPNNSRKLTPLLLIDLKWQRLAFFGV
jgi:hypothetical protein